MTSTATSASSANQTPLPYHKEFSISVPKNNRRRHSIMGFRKESSVKFNDWKDIKLVRENNIFDTNEEDMPKFGAGSEFGREAREEAIKKKYRTKSENQPWILKVNNNSKKKFKGLKQGGFGNNMAYYVFVQTPQDTIEAYPIEEWYNFKPIQTYKTLSAEEAEELINKKTQILDYNNIMIRKRLRNDDEDEDESLLKNIDKQKTNKKAKALKISDMEDWMDSNDDTSDSDKEDKSELANNSKKKKVMQKSNAKKDKKKKRSDDEAFEDSDDGDDEGRELDYISESSASEAELESQKEVKSVAEECSLKKLLSSEDEDEDETEKSGDKNDEQDKEEASTNKKNEVKIDKIDDEKEGVKDEKKNNKEAVFVIAPVSQNSTISMSSTASTSSRLLKRAHSDTFDSYEAKRFKIQSSGSFSSFNPNETVEITEAAVRRYLMRKPMTTTELVLKFKSKKTGLPLDQIAIKLTKILKNLKPTTEMRNDKMYFSIETSRETCSQ